jgi:tripartite-type tricarboxylate transporter receptor subunit TctC
MKPDALTAAAQKSESRRYPHVYADLAYDQLQDFEPVSQIATFDFAVAVVPQVLAKNLAELTIRSFYFAL